MERNKDHFRHLLLYFTALIRRKRKLPKLTDSSQELILSLLHQLKRVNTGIDDVKVVIFT